MSFYRLLRSYREQFGLEEYDFLPESYIIVPKHKISKGTCDTDIQVGLLPYVMYL